MKYFQQKILQSKRGNMLYTRFTHAYAFNYLFGISCFPQQSIIHQVNVSLTPSHFFFQPMKIVYFESCLISKIVFFHYPARLSFKVMYSVYSTPLQIDLQ